MWDIEETRNKSIIPRGILVSLIKIGKNWRRSKFREDVLKRNLTLYLLN